MNVRTLFLSLFVCLLLVNLRAQDNPSFIGLKGGASFPLRPYSGKNLETGCFTLPGFTTGIEGAWFFKPFLGLGGQFSYNLHPVDVGSLGYEKVQADPFLLDLTIRSDPYQVINAAVGLFTEHKVYKWFSVNGKLLGGVMWAKTPYQLYKPQYYMVGPEYYEITSSKDYNFSGTIGAGMQADVSGCLAIRLDGDLYYSKLVFGFNTANGIRYEYRTFSFINTSLMLVIKL